MRLHFSAILAASLIASAAQAVQPSETEAVDSAIACLSIADDADRLKCLDAAAKTLSVTRIVREEREAKVEENIRKSFGLNGNDLADASDTPDNFGSENIDQVRREKEAKRLKSIEAKVVEIRVNSLKVATVSLENGQVWRQLDSDDKVLHFGSKDRLYTAKVKRGAFGNYMLTVNELHTTIRVRRVK
ncbi:hypothetical protein [Hyphococcus sp.]|uniref:hypothetical protein n=1 Tax=Hyphococcus sp. TaxID=2038636 RepID=UPI00207D7A79|nr:MAG: hypothetical protein DHS20C04_06360 [Marinicaulis sp.]